MKYLVRKLLGAAKRWLTEQPPAAPERPIPFDNSYMWIGQTFRRMLADPLGGRYRPYAWGVLQGAALAKVLGYPRISVIEFGVAGGSGRSPKRHRNRGRAKKHSPQWSGLGTHSASPGRLFA